MVDKVVSLDEAIAVIADGDTVCVSGFVGIGTPEALLRGVEESFLAKAAPKDISLLVAAAPGNGKDKGLNRLAHPGLVKRAIGGHWSLIPKLGKLAVENQIEAYNLPLGCISQLYRDIAAGKPGMFSKVGLHTFVDPRQSGGAINERSLEKLVELQEIAGQEWLFYKSIPIDVAFIRGTTADIHGNITMEREALVLDNLPIAMAAKNSGGLVIAQVEQIAAPGSLAPKEVQVPGNLVDCVVQVERPEHQQTYASSYNHAFTGRIRAVVDRLAPMELDQRKVIARRAAFELPINGVVNLGIGMPEGVSAVANEEGIINNITLTAEAGIIGGVPQSGLDFGAAINADSIIQTNQQFDYYDGGGLDLACLGMAEVDKHGNVNVSRFKDRLAGAGGFINISQNARKLVFVGTFTAGGFDCSVKGGSLTINQEGRMTKFIDQVEQITFNGAYAASRGQDVQYITERAVFRLTKEGLELTEVAPGIDLQKDVLDLMSFRPIMRDVRTMEERIFRKKPMKLKASMMDRRLLDRFVYKAENNTVYADLSGLAIITPEDLTTVKRGLRRFFESIGQRVNIISNYDGVEIGQEVYQGYADLLRELEEKFYITATRYTTSAFMRQKLGSGLKDRSIRPHIFETQAEAEAYMADSGSS